MIASFVDEEAGFIAKKSHHDLYNTYAGLHICYNEAVKQSNLFSNICKQCGRCRLLTGCNVFVIGQAQVQAAQASAIILLTLPVVH